MGGSFETSGRDQLPADNGEVTIALGEREKLKIFRDKIYLGTAIKIFYSVLKIIAVIYSLYFLQEVRKDS